MLKFLGSKERTALLHVGKDRVVGLVVAKTCEFACFCGLVSAVVHRNERGETVAAAGHVIVSTKAACRVNAACSAFHSYVVSVCNETLAAKEGVVCGHVFKLTAAHCKNLLEALDTACRHGLLAKCFCRDIVVSVGCLNDRVILVGMKCYCLVSGKSPGSRRPDYKIGLVKLTNTRKLSFIVCNLEFYVDRGAVHVLVFYLSFS